MEPNELAPHDEPEPGRRRARLADAAAEDRATAANLVETANVEDARVTARKAERLGAAIVAVANRLGRISDLSTVLMAAARRDKDAIAMAALADSPSPRNDNVQ